MSSGSLWNYYIDAANNFANKNYDANNYRKNSHKTTTSKSLKYNTILIGNTPIIIADLMQKLWFY